MGIVVKRYNNELLNYKISKRKKEKKSVDYVIGIGYSRVNKKRRGRLCKNSTQNYVKELVNISDE